MEGPKEKGEIPQNSEKEERKAAGKGKGKEETEASGGVEN